MALIELIPKELSQIIDSYSIPIECDKCHRPTFAVLHYINMQNRNLCLNCFRECEKCKTNVSVYMINTIWNSFDEDWWTAYLCNDCISKC